MKLDLTKPVTTRDGREAGGWSVGPDGNLFGWANGSDGYTNPAKRYYDGRLLRDKETDSDLINAPETRSVTVWFNIYERDSPYAMTSCQPSREEADKWAQDRIACIERSIEFTVGEGLDDE
jgi:hypothetical protein